MMITFYSDKHRLHNPVGDWEVVERAELILTAVQSAGLGPVAAPSDWGMRPITAVHSPNLLHLLQTAYERMQQETDMPQVVPNCYAVRHLSGRRPHTIWGQLGYHCTDTTTPILTHTWEAAYWSAQTALSAAEHVWRQGGAAYALCRPPGHHAYADLYGGYCYLNNAAIAAHWLSQCGRSVAIVDVDYHHGNGTQAIFYDRADVLFCSLHGDPDIEYPFYCGYADERGTGAGEGFTYNFPLPLGTDGAAYLAAVQQAVDVVRQFKPDVLLVSLGVDTAVNDPNGGFLLETDDFTQVGQALAALKLPTLIVQEGGYILETIGADVAAFLRGFG